MRSVKGTEVWNEYGSLNEPLKVLGVERKVFGLAVTFGVAMFVAFESLFVGAVTFGAMYGLARALTWRDDRFLDVVKVAIQNPGGWFDPGLLEPRAWVLDVTDESERSD